jgi:hypothetical protein
MATSQGSTLKVNRAISAATTVNTNCYAVVTFRRFIPAAWDALHHTFVGSGFIIFLTRRYGPGQNIPTGLSFNGGEYYPLYGGVEFISG